MRIAFLGTPAFAVPSLHALLSRHEVVAVYTQPDRPKGRGGALAESPVKQAALTANLPLQQPERIRRAPNVEDLAQLALDLMVVVGYGQIIPQSIIDLPRLGILNVHASLLPKYRGAAPIQWAIARGERETGVTIMQIDAGLDTGDMLLKQAVRIEENETAPELSGRLAELGAALLLKTIDGLANGSVTPKKQDGAEATLAPILKKEDGAVSWTDPALEIYNRWRGFTPWPGAYSTFRGQRMNLVTIRRGELAGIARGALRQEGRRLYAGCGSNTALELLELQLAGKRRMSAEAFLNGLRLAEDEMLGDGL